MNVYFNCVLKSFDELSFLEQLNVKCDARAKALILIISEETIMVFPLISKVYYYNITMHV